ncbi:hypothetical protein BHM03_00040370 [Ensete ventricosum]|nr:hypothetical protein BHM03_00040370 [Ensete ventricosum]
MKNTWNNIIALLPLQEFMSLTSIQGKLYASAQCFHLLYRLPSCGLDTSPSCSTSQFALSCWWPSCLPFHRSTIH